MASDGRAEFDPSEIARVDFPTAFRGYDQDAVRRYLSRLAAAVGRAQELGLLGTVDPDQDDERFIELEIEAGQLRSRVLELESRLEAAVSESPPAATASGQPLDEAELIQLLGAETARILETARSAAADIVKRAESDAAQVKHLSEVEARGRLDEADSILAAARTEAADIVAGAEAELAKAQARIKADTARAAEESRADAERVLAEATGRADAELSAARRRSAELVANAEGKREEILGDLVTRRRISREQLVVMNAARDRLAVALASARNELDDVTSVLQRAAPAQEEIDVREPSPDVVAQAAEQATGTGPTADAQRAEVAELVALLDRNRPDILTVGGAPVGAVTVNGSPANGSAGNGSAASSSAGNGSGHGPAGHGPAGNGSTGSGSAGNGAAAKAAPATAAGSGLHFTSTDIPTNGNGSGRGGGAAVVKGDGIPMEYLTVEQYGSVEPQGAVALDDPPAELLVLSDTEHAVVDLGLDRTRPDLYRLGSAPAALLGHGPGGSMHRSATRGDLPRSSPWAGALPPAFEARDVALSRATPGFRRRLKRAVNDDQSDMLERLRAGRGPISVAELPPVEHQLDAYIDALRPVLVDVVTSGAEVLGCLDIPLPAVENLCLQLARHVVDCLRTPAIGAVERAIATDRATDREGILDPVRVIYRDFRNTTLPDLIEDALHEAFALGLYHAIGPDQPVLWATDPRLDPDPICEDNSASRALVKGSNFPSGHPRPLSMPGCRCLLIPAG